MARPAAPRHLSTGTSSSPCPTFLPPSLFPFLQFPISIHRKPGSLAAQVRVQWLIATLFSKIWLKSTSCSFSPAALLLPARLQGSLALPPFPTVPAKQDRCTPLLEGSRVCPHKTLHVRVHSEVVPDSRSEAAGMPVTGGTGKQACCSCTVEWKSATPEMKFWHAPPRGCTLKTRCRSKGARHEGPRTV